MSADTTPPPGERPRRIIKRYSNRKLYDTKDSRYVTLPQIAELVRSGEDVQVIDNATKEDKTEATLALIISGEVKSAPKTVPLHTLRELVHSGRERLLHQFREGPIGRFITPETAEAPPPEPPPPEPPPVVQPPPAAVPTSKNRLQELVDSSRQTVDEWRAAIDEQISALLPPFFVKIRGDVDKLSQRIEELEKRVSELQSKKEPPGKDLGIEPAGRAFEVHERWRFPLLRPGPVKQAPSSKTCWPIWTRCTALPAG
jgi:polyhydroxyalkanoate synthesis repressor PhaR